MDFYPSAKVKLAIRVEEFSEKLFNAKDLPARNAKKLNPSKEVTKPEKLDVVKDPARPGAFLLVQKGTTSKTPGPGQEQTQSTDGMSHSIAGIIPKSASLAFNWIVMADTLSLTIRWLDCPIDPRVIRAAAVDFYLGAVTPQEYAQGISGGTREGTASPLNLINDEYADQIGVIRTNRRFRGWVDEWKVTLDDSGEAVIELQCRDNTQLLIDQKAPQSPRLATDKPINRAIADYLAGFPQFEGLAVVYRPTDTPDKDIPTLAGAILTATPVVSEGRGGSQLVNGLGPPPSKGGGADGLSVWDYLRDYCGAVGLNIRMDGIDILIESPTTLVNDNAQPRPEDPYRPRSENGRVYDVRTFMYGKNVSSMDFSRNYNSKAPGNIEVRAYFPNKKTTLTARYPTKDKRVIVANPGDGKADSKWKVIRVTLPWKDKESLLRIAESQFHMRNRMELECHIKTRNLTSYAGEPLDTDILDARPGDSMQLMIDHAAYGSVSTVDGFLDSHGQDTKYLLEKGFAKEFVQAYQDARSAAAFPKKFVLKEMKVEWDSESGVDIDMTLINYIVARVEPREPKDTVTKR